MKRYENLCKRISDFMNCDIYLNYKNGYGRIELLNKFEKRYRQTISRGRWIDCKDIAGTEVLYKDFIDYRYIIDGENLNLSDRESMTIADRFLKYSILNKLLSKNYGELDIKLTLMGF